MPVVETTTTASMSSGVSPASARAWRAASSISSERRVRDRGCCARSSHAASSYHSIGTHGIAALDAGIAEDRRPCARDRRRRPCRRDGARCRDTVSWPRICFGTAVASERRRAMVRGRWLCHWRCFPGAVSSAIVRAASRLSYVPGRSSAHITCSRVSREIMAIGCKRMPSAGDNPPPPPRRRIRWRGMPRAFKGLFHRRYRRHRADAADAVLVWLFVDFVDHSVGALLTGRIQSRRPICHHVPGIGLVIVVVGLTLIGALTAGYARPASVADERPHARAHAGDARHLCGGEADFRDRAGEAVEQPSARWCWSNGRATACGRSPSSPAAVEGELQRRYRRRTISVYVPTTPNPTSGYLMFVPRTRRDRARHDGRGRDKDM